MVAAGDIAGILCHAMQRNGTARATAGVCARAMPGDSRLTFDSGASIRK